MMARFLWVILLPFLAMLPVRGASRETQMQSYRALLEAARSNPNGETLVSLGNGLYVLGRYGSDDDPEEKALIEELKKGAIAIPGHARAIAEEVERSRELALKEKSIAGMRYEMGRSKFLSNTLCHLPSPETIQVLGHYLDDERDTPPEELPHEGPRERDYVSAPENAWLALCAISNIGLRDAPIEPEPSALSGGYRHGPEATVVMRSAREWYAEVKEGKKPFSFIGQKEEYRFKPDGTWETTALVISDEEIAREKKSLAVVPSATSSAPAEQIAPDTSSPANRWAWWTAGATALLAAGAWLARNRHKNA